VGQTPSLAGEAREECPHRQVLAFALLHQQGPSYVLLGREMMLIDIPLVRVIGRETKGCEAGVEFQRHGIRTGIAAIRTHFLRGRIQCLPEPSLCAFVSDTTPQFLSLGCTSSG
jgi:hypothetical protein